MIRLKIVDQISVPYSQKKVVSILHNIENIAKFEPKIDRMRIEKESGQTAEFWAKGRFAGVPWWGRFSYYRHDRGFRSEMIKGFPSVQVRGGMTVRNTGAKRCLVIHDEQYEFRWLPRALAPMLKLYLKRSMRKELKSLERVLGASLARRQSWVEAKQIA